MSFGNHMWFKDKSIINIYKFYFINQFYMVELGLKFTSKYDIELFKVYYNKNLLNLFKHPLSNYCQIVIKLPVNK